MPDNDDFDVVDFMQRRQQQTIASAMNPDTDPEEAGRAIELGQSTGVHPDLISPDVEGFEQQHKAALTGDLLRNNQFLSQYVQSKPLAASVSQNDWGVLDGISQHLQKMWPIQLAKPALKAEASALGEAAEGFKEGFDREGQDQEYQQLYNYIDSPLWRRFVAPEIRDFSGVMHAMQGATYGGARFITSLARQAGMSEADSNDLLRDLVALPQVALPELGRLGIHPEMEAQIGDAAALARAARPHLHAGEAPPPGIHKDIDDVYKEQTRTDQKALKELEKQVDGSQTKELAPDYTADFIRQHIKTNIGVSADAIRELYGDKIPEAGDGKFGDIPDIQDKLEAATQTGGDVDIPLEDWLTKIEPEVRNEVRDGIRVRPTELTPEEIKGLKTEETPIDLDDQLRQAAGLPPILASSSGWTGETLRDVAPEGVTLPPTAVWRDINDRVKVAVRPTELWTENEQKISDAVDQEMRRILPGWAMHHGVDQVQLLNKPVQGLFQMFHDQVPLISWSFEAEKPLNVARHEALHFLRQMGLFTEGEWSTLISHAIDKDWIGKYNIDSRYDGLDQNGKLEEAIAEAFGEWRAGQTTDESVHPFFEKLKAFLESIKKTVLEAIGEKREITAQDLFLAADVGEIGRRKPQPLYSAQYLPELAAKFKDEDLVAQAGAYGLTKDQYIKHLSLVEQQLREAADARAESVKKAEARRQTKDWKDNRRDLRKEIADNIARRPDIAADNFIRTGDFFGTRVRGNTRLLESAVPEDLRAVLRDHVSKDGIHPDDIAGQFGFATGSEMVNRVADLAKQREDSGLQHGQFIRNVIDKETDRQMEARYGNLDANILSDVKDQLYSTTQMDLLHDQMLSIGMKAGAKAIDRPAVEAKAKEVFNEVPIKSASRDKYLTQSGVAGRKIQDFMREGKWTEALKASHEQFSSLLLAKEAGKLEKEKAKFDAQAKSLAARTKDSIEQEYLNWVHWIYTKIGKPIKRTAEDLQGELSAGDHDTFQDFVSTRRSDGYEIEAPEFLKENFQKDYDQLSIEEFRAIRDSVQSLVTSGRQAKVVIKGGVEQDFNKLRDRGIESLQTFSKKNYDSKNGRWLGPLPPKVANLARTWLASSLQMEALFQRWDRGEPSGVFGQWFFRPLAAASNAKDAMARDFSRKVRDIGQPDNLKGQVPNPLFRTPSDGVSGELGDLKPMTRKNLMAVLLNIGNESNLNKLAKGYNLHPEMIKAWADKYATKEDWEWAQKVGDIFADLKVEADKMYRRLSGIAPTNVEIKPFMAPHGEMKGWYYPLIADELWEGDKGGSKDSLLEQNYTRATTPRGYTKERTGATYPLSLQLDAMTNRMGQMIHDINMREAVMQFAKLAYDKKMQNEIKRYYGKEYADLLKPYIRDVANVSNYTSPGDRVFSDWSEFYRQNMISTLVGLNPNTVLKHGPTAAMNSITQVGVKNFLKATFGLLKTSEEAGESNWRFAMENSTELQRRHRNYYETLGGADKTIQGTQTLRDTIIKLGATPVAISDLLSAVPTWLAKYEDGIKAGLVKGDAVEAADTAVRNAHGSTAITSRPAIARGGAFASWVSSLYGFFSHILNRQYEMAWRAKDTAGLVAQGDLKSATAQVPKIAGMFFSYVIFPAMIESAVQGELFNNESWGKKAAKAIGFGLSSSWIGLRDAVGALMYNHDPSLGLFNTAYQTIGSTIKDMGRADSLGKERAGLVWQHANAALGLLSGWSNAQIGKVGRYLFNVNKGIERPKGFLDYQRGLRTGTQKVR